MFAYRSHGDFHEDCTNQIMKDLKDIMKPKWIRVIGDFKPRGGISISTVAEYIEKNYTVPEQYLKIPEDLHTEHK